MSTTIEEVVCDANNLYKAYRVSIKGSKWKTSTQRFMLNYLERIFEIKDALIGRTLQNGPIIEFQLNERGRQRSISSLCLPDRIVRHVLCDDIFMPEIRKRIIYDNGVSMKGRGIDFQRRRFEAHLQKYYRRHGNEGYILFGDFSKFYDNIIHELAKEQLLDLFGHDEFLTWLLDVIFEDFRIDVSYMTDEEYASCITDLFNKNLYREKIPLSARTGGKFMDKSVNIGDQLSQIIGIYYPHRIDNYVKTVRGQKFYGRYNDDFYIMNRSRDELVDLYDGIERIATEHGIHINHKKTRIVRISGTYRYLQVQYSLSDTGKVTKKINPKRVTAMRQKLKKLAVKVESGERTYEGAEEVFRSWMGAHYKLLSKTQRKNLITLYEELFSVKVVLIKKSNGKWKMTFSKEEPNGQEEQFREDRPQHYRWH